MPGRIGSAAAWAVGVTGLVVGALLALAWRGTAARACDDTVPGVPAACAAEPALTWVLAGAVTGAGLALLAWAGARRLAR